MTVGITQQLNKIYYTSSSDPVNADIIR